MSFPRYPEYKDSQVEWLGSIPSHWKVDRIKASVQSCRNGIWGEEAQGDTNDIPCVRVADFDRNKLQVILDEPTIRNVTEKERANRTLRKGDLLLEKSGGGEHQPVGCVVLYNDDRPAVCSNFVAKMELSDEMVPSYWRYVHAAAYSIRLTTGSINQTSGIQNLDQDRYFNERCVFPPFIEQMAIAEFLDNETSKIDDLVTEQELLIGLLKEKRQAAISNAVTKGLDPDVKMKNSGIEWLGDVPELWDVVPMKRHLKFLTSGSRGWADYYSDTGSLFIRIGNLTREGINLDLSDIQKVEVPNGAEGARTKVECGDVLFSITAYLGSVAVVPESLEKAYVSQHVALARLDKSRLSPEWVAFVVKSIVGKTYLETQGYGGTKIQLSLDDVANLLIPYPPINEQQKIIKYINTTFNEIEALLLESKKVIEILKERRLALVSAAVTGQIDVRKLNAI